MRIPAKRNDRLPFAQVTASGDPFAVVATLSCVRTQKVSISIL